MKACVVCQTELRDDAKFCPNCGAEQPRVEATPGEDPLLGAIVARKFKVEKLLGVGGMGKVYKARQLTLDKAVVVKVLHDQFRDDPQLVQRFQREARAASRLNHPNSIQIIDFGQDETGVVFMAMEFLQGQDLFAVLKKEGPLTADRLARVMIQVCSALAEAHEQNVIHRDLKPENIMVEDRRGQRDFVKVLDFGIAKIQDPGETAGQALTQAGMVCGTPEYMSPEQARGLQLDARSDIYALGVIMYQLSTGQLPFTADTPIGIVTKHILEKPVPPRQKQPSIPEALEQIILRALEKDTAARFSTVVELGEALDGFLRTLPAGGTGGFGVAPRSNNMNPAPVSTPGAPTMSGPSGASPSSGTSSTGGAARAATGASSAAGPSSSLTTAGPAPTGSLDAFDGDARPAGSPAMKIAAAAAVVVLVAGAGTVFAFRDKLFGSPAVVVDAGAAVVTNVVVDAGPPLPPPVVAAGMPAVVDAGTPAVVDAGAPAVVDAGTSAPATPTTPTPNLTTPTNPTTPTTSTPTTPKIDSNKRAAASAAMKKLIPRVNEEFSSAAGCSKGLVDELAQVAAADPTYPDPMQRIAFCAFKAKAPAAACAAAKEFVRRGGAAALQTQMCR